jgi:hypothetical protein
MPPERIPRADLAAVAKGLLEGQRQTQVAESLGWTKFRVQRCLLAMRSDLARALTDPAWLDTAEHGPVKVAREWQAKFSQPDPKNP